MEETALEPEDRVGKALVKVGINDSDPEKLFLVGNSLSHDEISQLVSFLKKNLDVFA